MVWENYSYIALYPGNSTIGVWSLRNNNSNSPDTPAADRVGSNDLEWPWNIGSS